MRQRLFSFLGLALVAALALPLMAYAQEAAAAAAAPAPQAPAADMTTLWGLWKVGGPIMYPMLVLCIAAVTIAVYGFINTPESKMLCPDLIPSIHAAVDQLDMNQLQTICNANPSLLTNILSAGIQRVGVDGTLDVPTMEKAMEEASVEEVASGLKTINYLSIIASLAPMLGLLGTVTGMIKAFDAIAKGGMGQPDKLAGNIGEAMVTTAAGLIVGIPAMFCFFHLKGRYNNNVARLSRVLGNVTFRLSEVLRNGPSAPAAGK